MRMISNRDAGKESVSLLSMPARVSCVDPYSGARGYEAAYEWYQRLQGYEGMKKKKAEMTALTGDIIMMWKQVRKPVCMDYVDQV